MTKLNLELLTLTENAAIESPPSPVVVLLRVLFAIAVISAIAFVITFGIRQVQASDPYIHNVLALHGEQERGQAIFQMNCAVCHGIEANGEVGPSLLKVSGRMSKVRLIKQVTSGRTPPMPQFQPEAQDMADLLAYLESL
ncbi:MAG: c-type cytochrome [Leptolyngbyaceae cyanobacterium]